VTYEKIITLHVGGVHASAEPTVIKTLLGSCIAVCLWDPRARIGGMNHFMLPEGRGDGSIEDATRFGVHAMDRLIGEMLKLGAEPRRFAVKVFGGASVLALKGAASVPQANVEFVRTFLAREGFHLAAKSVGGTYPRQVHFFTESGKALVRRVVGPQVEAALLEQEQRRRPRPQFGDVTLF
jgi:chemotaxis receptor (MCP) glutamine deamidase CheD